MLNNKRRKNLLKVLAEKQRATVDQLVKWLNASPATVRRDISWLAERNLLVRTRGGVEFLAPKEASIPLAGATFQHNLTQFTAEKRAIAQRAASLCQDGECIIINGGTTTYMMGDFLTERHLKILTNSFLMAERLLTNSQNEIIVPGGQIYREQNVILSPFDSDITQHHYASKIFMGACAVSQVGLLESDPLLIQAEKKLLSQADELILLADSSKFSKKAGLILCTLEQLDYVITDDKISDQSVNMLEAAGVKVLVESIDTD
ncbi:DeoR/GlpR family DNA-binding transcription regulator [Leeia sp. TBRC 13508]|uniref:DeoR/GlpR family DNA-binding transcription regulator n=1 Tax=Leeia speluncae TaxID=2884804 RepID=A0ABS8D553_9NEIS|nr:DeoR/GlpR family DNA-binding transcription regulator [Leeia speluncae]MCB6183346.1 DeoR/GlpR family DNA-binding transcription regulator [Leeia speluncae]